VKWQKSGSRCSGPPTLRLGGTFTSVASAAQEPYKGGRALYGFPPMNVRLTSSKPTAIAANNLPV
jgi:hypothetical protein